ncbi:MAG: HEAT repeat domain-containing protein [bacterium]
MKRISLCVIACILLSLSFSYAQTLYVPAARPALAESYVPGDGGDDEKDPGYATYKEGYALILADKWSESMKKMGEVKSKFPKSAYIDDAAYWSAYAQKRLDPKKGAAAYEKFLSDYPESSYADDAMADMQSAFNLVVTPGGNNVRVRTAPHAYSYSFGSTMRTSEEAMRRSEQAMREVGRSMRRSRWTMFTPRPPVAPIMGEEEKERTLDPQTRLKLAALQALGESENDKDAFAALKEVALDKSQPEVLRITAINSLQDFKKFDVQPVLIDVARNDGSEEVQLAAISTLGDLGGDKNKSVDALISLFNGYPKQKEKHLESALYAIADVGNDKAVDFLVKVATSNENIDLRSDAVYYLGNIGNEKSRTALMQILKSK